VMTRTKFHLVVYFKLEYEKLLRISGPILITQIPAGCQGGDQLTRP
jgi:hypothetical protein